MLFLVSFPHTLSQVLTSSCSWEVGEGSGHKVVLRTSNSMVKGRQAWRELSCIFARVRAAMSKNQDGRNWKDLVGHPTPGYLIWAALLTAVFGLEVK